MEFRRFFADKIVLIVEDQEVVREVLIELLEAYGLTLEIAEDGQQAVDCLLQMQIDNRMPDLILMDLIMPVMDGWKAIQKIRTQPEFQKIPIVVLSADVLIEHQQKMLDLGVQGYITKPLDFDKLLHVLAKFLQVDGTSSMAQVFGE